jgi:hypothetical protein
VSGDPFVNDLVMAELGFERADAAETGRPGYDLYDLFKLYLWVVAEPRRFPGESPSTWNAMPKTDRVTMLRESGSMSRLKICSGGRR